MVIPFVSAFLLSFVTKECNVFVRFDNGVGIGNFGKEPLSLRGTKILFCGRGLNLFHP